MTITLSLFIIFLTATGQVLLKKGALVGERLFINKYVFLGYSTFIIVVMLSIMLMNYLPLKYFAIIVSFSYPTTILFARFFLNERLSRQTAFACLIVLFGCIVFNL